MSFLADILARKRDEVAARRAAVRWPRRNPGGSVRSGSGRG